MKLEKPNMKPTLTILTVLLLSPLVALQASELVKGKMDWAAFLNRQDPVWGALPQKFDHGAFAGNGTLGLTIFQEGENALRFAMGRNDITSRARDNARLLIGGLRLTTKGKLIGGELRIDLWNAEIRGSAKTELGSLKFTAFVHARRNLVVIEHSASGGEADCAWTWMPEMAATGNASYDGFENILNPPCESGVTDGVAWCWQKRTAGGSYTAAWMKKGERLFFTIADSFPQDESKLAAFDTLRQAAAQDADVLSKEHRGWWHSYYPASFLSVPDTQVEGFYWIQIYKLASAMRPDGMVMDLQGPWSRASGWPRIWWNLNIQIAYSPVYAANRLELGESFTRFIDSRRQAFVRNAKTIYGFDDCATTPHTSSYDGTNGDGQAAAKYGNYINPGDFTWALWLYWQQYRYSMDESLMRRDGEHAFYPLLKGSVNLYMRLLQKDANGILHLPKMHSPEYGNAADNNYNLSLLRWACETLLALNERYRFEDPQVAEWRRVLKELTPYPSDANGFMIGADMPFSKSHRHWSHMLMVWPLHTISCEQPENKEIVEKTLSHWLNIDNGRQIYGWSAAAAAHIYATLGDGKNALQQLRSHHDNKRFVMPNTQYIEGSPVYECSLIAASSLQYMLLQSWGGIIRVFPAVPDEWAQASYQNLRAEGAFLVSAIRRDGKTLWVRVESLAGEQCLVKPGFRGSFDCDHPDKIKAVGNGIYEIALKKGEAAILYQGQCAQNVQPCDQGLQKPNVWGLKELVIGGTPTQGMLDTTGSLSLGKPAKASSEWSAAFAAGMATDGKIATRWSPASGKRSAWLELDLLKDCNVERAELYEFEQRIVSWALEVKDGENWRAVANGGMVGAKKTISFPAIKARYLRFNILESDNGVPSILEFQLFGKDTVASPESGLAASSVETDERLHSEGKGWGLDQAKVVDAARPRILLVGDSILHGYLETVKAELKGKAYVDAWMNPYWQSETLNKLLGEVLDKGPYDVVHINTGLHGWANGRIKEVTFEPLTKAMIEVIRGKCPKAKIIWANSTPVTTKKPAPPALNPDINPNIIEQNRMAAKVMAEMNVPVNDFYSLLVDKLELARGDQFHWKNEAYPILGKLCSDSILKALKSKTPLD